MSTNNLLLSLLANSSANPRSSSLMLKNTISNPYFLGRSNSISHVHPNPTPTPTETKTTADSQNNVSLIRFTHLVNLKVKNHYYFFFCKLQQNLKKQQNLQNSSKITDYDIPSEKKVDLPLKQLANTQHDQLQVKGKKLEDSIIFLSDSFNTFNSKRQILIEQKIKIGFQKIHHFSIKRQQASSIINTIILHNNKLVRQVFDLLQKMERERMRNQILDISLTHIFFKITIESFQAIKLHSKNKKEELVRCNSSRFTTSTCNQNNQFYNREEDFSISQTSQKSNRTKIILREKKIATAQPIIIPQRKTSKINIKEELPLERGGQLINDNKMMHCLKIKQDVIVNSISEFSDNCHLFRQQLPSLPSNQLPTFPSAQLTSLPSITSNRIYTLDSLNTDNELNTCATDRTENMIQKIYSKQLRDTPKYSREKKSNNNSSKKVTLQNEQSPLAKIDEILNRIEQMKNHKSSKSSEKKMVNVNLTKQIYRADNNPSKYRLKPTSSSNKKNEVDKQNQPERLITQREAGSKPRGSGGLLQSGTKYKSTTLQKGKQREGQLSTARKMKMEIENIINRRNKQLFRGESAQLT